MVLGQLYTCAPNVRNSEHDAAAAVPVVGHRDRGDPGGLRRSRPWRRHNCAGFTRYRLLPPGSGPNFEIVPPRSARPPPPPPTPPFVTPPPFHAPSPPSSPPSP